MIILNLIDSVISASVDSEILTKTYSEEVYKQLSELADKANNASTVKEYQESVQAFKESCKEEINGYLGTFHQDIFIENKTGKFFLKCNGKISAVPMPETMVTRIKESIDKKIDINPLLKTWIRFLRNPQNRPDTIENFLEPLFLSFGHRFFNFIDIKYTNQELVSSLMTDKGYSREVATKMATTYSMKLTQEGLLAGFKVSEEITTRYRLNEKGEKESYNVYNTGKKSIDPISGLITQEQVELSNEDRVFRPAVMKDDGDAFFCGNTEGHIIRVGQVHRLSGWDKVDCSDTGRPGLHFGGLDYIRNYQTEHTETHNIFVDPAHVGAISDDSRGAVTCLQYFVCDAFSGVNGSIYHSSKYAAQTDEQWAKEKEEIIKKYGEYKDTYLKSNQDTIDSVNSL